MTNPPANPAFKRRFPRYPVDVRVDITVFRDGNNTSFWGRSTEISEDGVGCTLTGEIESGEVVWMNITLPLSTNPVKLRALVRYRSGLRHGFEFLTRSPEQRRILQRTCEMLAAKG